MVVLHPVNYVILFGSQVKVQSYFRGITLLFDNLGGAFDLLSSQSFECNVINVEMKL